MRLHDEKRKGFVEYTLTSSTSMIHNIRAYFSVYRNPPKGREPHKIGPFLV